MFILTVKKYPRNEGINNSLFYFYFIFCVIDYLDMVFINRLKKKINQYLLNIFKNQHLINFLYFFIIIIFVSVLVDSKSLNQYF